MATFYRCDRCRSISETDRLIKLSSGETGMWAEICDGCFQVLFPDPVKATAAAKKAGHKHVRLEDGRIENVILRETVHSDGRIDRQRLARTAQQGFDVDTSHLHDTDSRSIYDEDGRCSFDPPPDSAAQRLRNAYRRSQTSLDLTGIAEEDRDNHSEDS